MNNTIAISKNKNQPSKLELFREKIRGDTALMYRLTVYFFVVAYIVTIALNLVLRKPHVYEELPLGEGIMTTSTNYVVTEKYKSENDRDICLVLNLEASENRVIEFQELKFDYNFAGGSREEKRQAKFHVVKGDRTYYEIFFENLPEDWSAVRFDVLDENNKRLARFYFNKIPATDDEFEVLRNDLDKSSEATTVRSINERVRLMEKRINIEIPEELDELYEERLVLEENIKTIKQEQRFETSDQQQNSNNRIRNIESQIARTKRNSENLRKEEDELLQRISLLHLKQDELIDKYNIDKSKVFFDN